MYCPASFLQRHQITNSLLLATTRGFSGGRYAAGPPLRAVSVFAFGEKYLNAVDRRMGESDIWVRERVFGGVFVDVVDSELCVWFSYYFFFVFVVFVACCFCISAYSTFLNFVSCAFVSVCGYGYGCVGVLVCGCHRFLSFSGREFVPFCVKEEKRHRERKTHIKLTKMHGMPMKIVKRCCIVGSCINTTPTSPPPLAPPPPPLTI